MPAESPATGAAGPPAGPDSGELEQERAWLTHARSELARMRERTLALEAHGGDWVSSQFLASTLRQRAESLVDDPGTALFFGRIDTAGAGPDGVAPPATERWYIGRRHVSDAEGEPVVVDWRAGISTLFYRASRTEPMGLTLRRRFGIDRGELTAYEDERLDRPRTDEPSSGGRTVRRGCSTPSGSG